MRLTLSLEEKEASAELVAFNGEGQAMAWIPYHKGTIGIRDVYGREVRIPIKELCEIADIMRKHCL